MLEKPSLKASTLHNHPSSEYAKKLSATRDLLKRAASEFGPCVQASSLGVEDMIITDILLKERLTINVFVLDTGALHTQTLALLERLQARFALHASTDDKPVSQLGSALALKLSEQPDRTYHRPALLVYKPELSQVIHFIQREGQDAMYKSQALRKNCCAIRKLEPLSRALMGQKAWITGLRSEQSPNRSAVQWIEQDTQNNLPITKINPLMDWTWGDVWHYAQVSNLDYNPLHDQFYPSIGCAPCTRAISLGEDFRAGRWWWEDASAKECGLHKTQDQSSQSQLSSLQAH